MKTEREILKLALKNINLMNSGFCNIHIKGGLCRLFRMMKNFEIITIEESQLIKGYIYSNKPNNHIVKLYDGFVPDYFFWKEGRKLPRILYLIKHIRLLNK